MSDEKKKPGPKAETFSVPLPFDDAIKAALETAPPQKKPGTTKKRR